jgi:hypothetical protein
MQGTHQPRCARTLHTPRTGSLAPWAAMVLDSEGGAAGTRTGASCNDAPAGGGGLGARTRGLASPSPSRLPPSIAGAELRRPRTRAAAYTHTHRYIHTYACTHCEYARMRGRYAMTVRTDQGSALPQGPGAGVVNRLVPDRVKYGLVWINQSAHMHRTQSHIHTYIHTCTRKHGQKDSKTDRRAPTATT